MTPSDIIRDAERHEVLTAVELVRDPPPPPWLSWGHEGAVRRWLLNKGFDLSRPMARTDDIETGDIYFYQ